MSLNLRLGAALLLCATTGTANACGAEPYVGEVCTFAFNYCPQGYLPADGSVVSIAQNQVLFALLGTTFGGNGTTTFALPDLRGRAVVGTGAATGPTSQVQLGQKRGQEAVTVGASNLPAAPVAVTLNVSQASAAIGTPNPGDLLAVPTSGGRPQPLYVAPANAGTQVALGGTQAALQGGGQPLATLPPELGMTQCIASQGLFPSRP